MFSGGLGKEGIGGVRKHEKMGAKKNLRPRIGIWIDPSKRGPNDIIPFIWKCIGFRLAIFYLKEGTGSPNKFSISRMRSSYL
jgi:hypothetical protein